MKASSYNDLRGRQLQRPTSKLVRVMQSVGAALVALGALWFLFGIPAYLLFGSIFD